MYKTDWNKIEDLDENLNTFLLLRCTEYDKIKDTKSIIYIVNNVPNILQYKTPNGDYVWENLVQYVKITHFIVITDPIKEI